MSSISKACLEISKSLKNFKFNRNSQDNQKEPATTSDNQSSQASSNPANSQPSNVDASWSSSGELSVAEALTRVFRQATNRVRSFSSSDRSGCPQSFAVVVPTTSPTSASLPPPFLSAPPPSPATTNSENSSDGTSKNDVARTAAMEPLNVAMETYGRFVSLVSNPSVKSDKVTQAKPKPVLNLESPEILWNSERQQKKQDVDFPIFILTEDMWKNKTFLIYFFKYFSISQLCTLAQVCRLWREILYSDARYWVDATPRVNCRELSQQDETIRKVFYSSLEIRKFDSLCLIGLLDDDIGDVIRLFPYSNTGVRKLSVRCSNVTDGGLKKLIDFMTSTTSLELSGCNEITEAGLWNCLCSRFVCLTLADCINVADESVSAVAQLLINLKEFNLQAYHVTDAALSVFSNKQSTCLKTLRLLSCWEITNHGVVNVIRSLPNLTVLSLSGCSKITDDGVEVLSENLRQLKSLDLSWCSRITDSSLEYIACDLCLLQELTLDRCNHVSDIGVGYLSTMLSLTHLFLRWCNQVRDFGIQRISNMKNLKVLSLAGCNMVTSSGITKLTQLTNLRELELTNCSALTSSDIVAFLHDKMPNCVIIE